MSAAKRMKLSLANADKCVQIGVSKMLTIGGGVGGVLKRKNIHQKLNFNLLKLYKSRQNKLLNIVLGGRAQWAAILC